MCDPLDQALRDQPDIVPSPAFARRVMRAVRHQAAHRAGLPFPWRITGGGLALTAAFTVATLLAGDLPALAAPAPALAWLAPVVAWPTATLAATLGLAWCSVRLVGRS